MGNLATESLIHLLDDLGFTTGISLAKLFDAGNYLQQVLGRPLPSRLFQAGPN
jgi:hydroxymethylglutaryl-CoA lyase